MSKLPFTIAPVLYRRTVAEKLAPNGFIVHKKKSRFGLCVALASAIAFLLPFAIGSAFAHDMNVFELRLEHAGNMYVLDSAMTGDDCINATHEANAFIDEHGRKVAIAADDPLYCVSM